MQYLNEDYPFQIFMTSHSPILVAHANLDALIILEKNNNEINAINWNALNLDEKDTDYFKKFFPMGKSNLLFAKKVILVEGPSERLLLPFFAKIKGILFENENIELIELSGNRNVFHYANLFLNSEEKEYLKKKCAILIDNDKNDMNDSCSDIAIELWENYNGDNIGIFISEKDFEFEIINSNKNNNELLQYLLLDQNVVSNISKTREFLNNLNEESTLNNLIYDYVNEIKFRKTNLPMKIIDEWESLEGFKIPEVIENLFEFLKED